MLATVGRALAQHWPALVALHLAGILARYGLIELAGWVGSYSPLAGLLLMPLPVLVRAAAFVGMFLIVRESLRNLRSIAELPQTAAERRRSFLDALLAGLLPFIAVYHAAGETRDDWNAYTVRVLDLQSNRSAVAGFSGEPLPEHAQVYEIALDPLTISIVVFAILGRWAWGNWGKRLPKWLGIGAVYLEALWVYLSVTVLFEFFAGIRGWVDSRQALHWVEDARGWLEGSLAPVAWLWDGVDWVLGHAGAALGQPLAWLTIAGVLYGQAVAAKAPTVPERFARARSRYAAMPDWVRKQAGSLWLQIVARFLTIWRAFVLMLRGGPLLIGLTALLYACVESLGGVLSWAIPRLHGPEDLLTYWALWDVVLLLPVALVVEVLRVAVVAGAYDATIGRLRQREAAAVDAAVTTDVTDAAARDVVAGVVGERAGEDVPAEGATDVAPEDVVVEHDEPERAPERSSE